LTDRGQEALKVFVSYSWDDGHRDWVRDLASRLRSDGVDAGLDRWKLAPGDQLPEFMERAVRENDFVPKRSTRRRRSSNAPSAPA
jgi:hypothetical protein